MAIVRTLCAVAAVVLLTVSVAVTAQDTDFDTKMRDADSLLARRQYEDALRIYKDARCSAWRVPTRG